MPRQSLSKHHLEGYAPLKADWDFSVIAIAVQALQSSWFMHCRKSITHPSQTVGILVGLDLFNKQGILLPFSFPSRHSIVLGWHSKIMAWSEMDKLTHISWKTILFSSTLLSLLFPIFLFSPVSDRTNSTSTWSNGNMYHPPICSRDSCLNQPHRWAGPAV